MATQWSDLYEQVATVLLEDASSLAGDFTEDQFLSIAGEILTDFCGRTGLQKKIFNYPLQQGVQLYPENDLMGDLLSSMASQSFLYESSDFFLSEQNPYWQNSVGVPYSYREDSIDAQMLQINPAPDFQGTQVGALNPGYGVIGGTGQQIFWNFIGGPGYGIISGYTSATLNLLAANAGYGVIANTITPSVYQVSPDGYGTISAGSGWFFNQANYLDALIPYGYGTIYGSTGMYLNCGEPGFGVIGATSGVVAVIPSNPGYGVPSSLVTMFAGHPIGCSCNCQHLQITDFWIDADPLTPVGFGTVCGFNGNPYAEASNPGFGIICDMVPSTANLSMIGTALPFNIANLSINDWIELVPDGLTQYLKYGILARMFSSDAETRDDQKSQYCQSRYMEGVSILSAIMNEDVEE